MHLHMTNFIFGLTVKLASYNMNDQVWERVVNPVQETTKNLKQYLSVIETALDSVLEGVSVERSGNGIYVYGTVEGAHTCKEVKKAVQACSPHINETVSVQFSPNTKKYQAKIRFSVVLCRQLRRKLSR